MILSAKDPLAEILDRIEADPMAEPSAKVPPANYQPKSFEEPCAKCRGTGRFTGWSGRSFGPCFACKGAGKKVFKTSSEQRAKASAAKANKKASAAKANKKVEQIEAFKVEHPDVFEWMQGDFGPAREMLADLIKYGSLFDSRIAFAKSMIEKRDAARQAAQAEKAERVASAQPINATALEEAFAKASKSSKRVMLWIGSVRIRPARNKPGVLYVVDAGIDQYLGKVEGGKFIASRGGRERELEMLKILADPKAAAIEHGKLTGACSVCRRTLTDADSIAAGIGPVCATKMGW